MAHGASSTLCSIPYSTKISSLHRDYIKKIRAYRFDENELIDSDHVDFIGE